MNKEAVASYSSINTAFTDNHFKISEVLKWSESYTWILLITLSLISARIRTNCSG
jgi:hypothetical protein